MALEDEKFGLIWKNKVQCCLGYAQSQCSTSRQGFCPRALARRKYLLLPLPRQPKHIFPSMYLVSQEAESAQKRKCPSSLTLDQNFLVFSLVTSEYTGCFPYKTTQAKAWYHLKTRTELSWFLSGTHDEFSNGWLYSRTNGRIFGFRTRAVQGLLVSCSYTDTRDLS